MQTRHRHSIGVDRLTWMGWAREGQLFGFKIEHLNLCKIFNKINSHSFDTVTKWVHYQITQIAHIYINLCVTNVKSVINKPVKCKLPVLLFTISEQSIYFLQHRNPECKNSKVQLWLFSRSALNAARVSFLLKSWNNTSGKNLNKKLGLLICQLHVKFPIW